MLSLPTAPGHGARQVFIGRANEIARLRAGLDDAREGRGRLILLSGPPGIGKSRLAAEFIRLVTDEGIRALVGRSWEAGGAPPYWPWVQILRAYLRAPETDVADRGRPAVAELATLLPELAELRAGDSPLVAVDPSYDRFRLFDATATFLRDAAEEGPLVVVLEDLQAADVPSLLLLQFVADQIEQSGILLVATYRDVELTPEHPLASTLAQLQRAPGTLALAVPGLDAREVVRFVEATAGTPPRATVALTLHRQTSGNPLFLREAVRLLAHQAGDLTTAPAGRAVVPAEIRAVIERRLDGLGASTREILEVGAVFGNEFELDWVRRYRDGPVEDSLELLGEAVMAGLVVEEGGRGRFRFSHDLIRHGLYAGLAPSRRIGLHRRAAAILEEAYGAEVDAHLATLALHHFEAAPGGDPGRAADYGRRAGEHALASLAYEEAVRLYQMAVQVIEGEEKSDPTLLVDLLLSLGDARVRAGDLPEAAEAFLRAADIARRLGDSRRLARAAVEYGGRFIWSRVGADTRMVPLLQDALVLLGGDDDRLRVRLLSRLACALRSSVEREHGAALSRQALEVARQMDDPETLIFALTGRAGALWWPENPEERLEIGSELVAVGEAIGSVEGMVDGHMTRCAALAEMGEVGAARRELEVLARIGGPLRLPAQHWLEGAMRSWFALLEGSLAEVEPWIDELRRQAPTTPARDNVSAASFQLFLLRREQARLGEIEEAMRRAAADFPWYPVHRIALAYLLVVGGQEGEARHILGQVGADRFASLHRDNYWLLTLCLAAEVTVRLGDRDTAQVVYELLEPHATRHAVGFAEGSLGSVARYLGLIAALMGDEKTAERHLESAEAANRRMGARPWLAHTLYDRAGLLARRDGPGDSRQASALMAECMKMCAELGLVDLEGDASASPVVAPEDTAEAVNQLLPSVFRREGDYFSVGFAGAGFRLRDSKGMRYLAILLSAPGREIHVLDLVGAIEGADPASRGRISPTAESVGNEDAGPVLDRRAREAYKERLGELDETISEAEAFGDDERASVAREERDFVVAELAAAMGLGGRDRQTISVSERARVNVTRAIRTALGRISDASAGLGDHLEATIHTGAFCSYTPDPRTPVTWDT